jgi:hypothetical protein
LVVAFFMFVGGEHEEGRTVLHEGHQEHQEHKVTLPTISNYTIPDAAEDSNNGKQEEGTRPRELSIYCGFATSCCV